MANQQFEVNISEFILLFIYKKIIKRLKNNNNYGR